MKKRASKPKRGHLSSAQTGLPDTKGCVLIVGYEDPVRNIVSATLTSGGHEWRALTGGSETLALLEAGEKYDVILTDIVNDQIGGIGILERTRERFPDVEVILMTSMRRISYALVGVREGAFDYLTLPFEPEQLLFFVRRAAEHRRLKLRNRDYEKRLGPLATSKKPARILIQDDEEPIREIVSSMLTSSRYECRTVESPQGALDILTSREKFDLVLCGLIETLDSDFFKRVNNRFPDIPLVVLSACYGWQLFQPALRDGAYDYLNKPFELEQIQLKIHRALEYRRLRLENQAYARMRR